MKSLWIVTFLFASLVSSNPLNKKSVEFTTTVEIVTVVANSSGNVRFQGGFSMVTPGASAAGSNLETSATLFPTSSTTGAAFATSAASTLNSYSQAILDQHNNHRQNASAPALSWSTDLADIAAEIAASCVYAESSVAGGGYGQNIGAGAEPSAVPALITNIMYNNEIEWYPTPYGNDSPDMTRFEKWGHYSQIVWKSTTNVGCATQYCPDGLANTGSGVAPYFTVCNYSPPGNVAGKYSNVGAPSGGVANVVVSS